MKTSPAKMTREEMMALAKGDIVTVVKTGKVYRVTSVDLPYTEERNAEIVADMVKQEADRGYYSGPVPGWQGAVYFVQQRAGKDYGPVRPLKPESIARV